jgi:protein-S-isoprenylcysteine O-methyltransferase Ste14
MEQKISVTVKVSFMLTIFYIALMLCLFIPAVTIRFYEAWFYFGTFFIWSNILTFYFLFKNPELIERRTQIEQQHQQQIIQSINALMFIALIVIPGLDFRYNLTSVPFWLVFSSYLFITLGFLIVFFVFKQNSFLASNIKVYESQTVVTTGLYSFVRHPMYSGTYLIILFTPFALGSYLALIPAVVIGVLIVFRTLNEEKILLKELDGYKDYCDKVRYRYFPYIW